MSWFAKNLISTVTLTCHRDLVPYNISKVFFFVETEEGGVGNIPTGVKVQIHNNNLHQEDILITCKATISSIVNTLKNCHCNRYVSHVFLYNSYEDRYVEFLNLEFIFLSKGILLNWNILPL